MHGKYTVSASLASVYIIFFTFGVVSDRPMRVKPNPLGARPSRDFDISFAPSRSAALFTENISWPADHTSQ